MSGVGVGCWVMVDDYACGEGWWWWVKVVFWMNESGVNANG